MEKIKVKIVNESKHPHPTYATQGAAGMDIYANLPDALAIQPFERVLVPTGLHIELPLGYEAQLRMRSGLARKKGLILPNAPATIDSDYRGEIFVMIANISGEVQHIQAGDRIAQMVVARHETVEWLPVDALSDTHRGKGGFGSTGR